MQSNFDLFRQGQRIVDFDPQIPHGAFKLRVAKKKLACPKVAGLAVQLRNLGPAH